MVRWLAVGLLGAPLWAAAPGTVNDVIELVREGLRSGQPDGAIERSLRKVKLAESLDRQVIEELESEGAGKRAVAELEQLREASRGMAKPAVALPFDHPAKPSTEDRKQVLDGVHTVALNYGKSLPDFICMQIIRRWDNLKGTLRPKDTLDVKLTYFGQNEDYKLLSINGRPAFANYSDVGGATTQGEFGTLMRLIFDAASETRFEWSHWTTLRKQRAHVFAFQTRIPRYRMEFQRGRATRRLGVTVTQRGFIYVDRANNSIVRIVADADGIPREFPVRLSSTVLDYEFTKVGSREYLLPLRAEIRMGTSEVMTRNEVEFKSYQKFSSEATISFEPK